MSNVKFSQIIIYDGCIHVSCRYRYNEFGTLYITSFQSNCRNIIYSLKRYCAFFCVKCTINIIDVVWVNTAFFFFQLCYVAFFVKKLCQVAVFVKLLLILNPKYTTSNKMLPWCSLILQACRTLNSLAKYGNYKNVHPSLIQGFRLLNYLTQHNS